MEVDHFLLPHPLVGRRLLLLRNFRPAGISDILVVGFQKMSPFFNQKFRGTEKPTLATRSALRKEFWTSLFS